MWHVSKIQIIQSSLLCFTESQKVLFLAKFTVAGGKMARFTDLHNYVLSKIYAVLKITCYLLPAYQVWSKSANLACRQFCMVLSKIGCRQFCMVLSRIGCRQFAWFSPGSDVDNFAWFSPRSDVDNFAWFSPGSDVDNFAWFSPGSDVKVKRPIVQL